MRLISSKRSEAKHKTPYSFISEVTFIYFKVKLLGGLEISPLNLLIFSHSLDIRILISLKILHRVASEILVKFDIFDASISSAKYFKISLNLASEIRERTIYLFFNFATLVTFQEHSSHRNLILLFMSLS